MSYRRTTATTALGDSRETRLRARRAIANKTYQSSVGEASLQRPTAAYEAGDSAQILKQVR